MSLLIAILLALFVLPTPWNALAVATGAVWEVATALGGLWYSRRGRPRVGTETLVGREALVVGACRPIGQVRVGGEIWRARCESGADRGELVRVAGVEGLTLVVERGA